VLTEFDGSVSHHLNPAPPINRYCLASLQHGNTRDEEDILQCVRSSPALAKDFERLRQALAVLRPTAGDSPTRVKTSSPRAAKAVPTTSVLSARSERKRLRQAVKAAEAAVLEAERSEAEVAQRRAMQKALRRSVESVETQLAARASASEAARAAVRAAAVGRRPLSASAAAGAAAAVAASAAAASVISAGDDGDAGDNECGVDLQARCSPPVRRAAKSQLGKHLLGFDCDEVR